MLIDRPPTTVKSLLIASAMIIFLTVTGPISSRAALFEKSGRWPKNDVSVCWSRASSKEGSTQRICDPAVARDLRAATNSSDLEVPSGPLREQVKDLITTNFTPARTGIQFTGWTLCDPKAESDIRLYVGEADQDSDIWGVSSIGNCGAHDGLQMTVGQAATFIALNTAERSLLNNINLVAMLHEFGHLAGLLHEDKNTLEKPQLKNWARAPRDPFSVMSYKWVWKFCVGEASCTPTDELNVSESSEYSDLDPAVTSPLDSSRDATSLSSKNSSRRVQIRPGLSTMDVKTLRCNYLGTDCP